MDVSGTSGIFSTPMNYFTKTGDERIASSNTSCIRSILAIGNPIVDISAEIDRSSIQRYNLIWNGTFFADENNMGFFDELESKPQVTYIPGGSIQNTLRVCSWCLNQEEKNRGKFRLTMLGAVGQDGYKAKIFKALETAGVKPLLQIIPNMTTSRCGVGICQKERCLLPHIKASNCLTEEFVSEHEDEIYENDALLIEGYFLQEKYELCKHLCKTFKRSKKLVILTLSAVFMIQYHREKIMEIAENSDIIVCNMEEMEAFAETQRETPKNVFKKAHLKLTPKNRLFIVTDGGNGVYISRFDYKKGDIDYLLQSFPRNIKNEDICDLNGAGDAFLGGFLSQFMKGEIIPKCCKIGNDAAFHIIQNVGCTFNQKKGIISDNNSKNDVLKL